MQLTIEDVQGTVSDSHNLLPAIKSDFPYHFMVERSKDCDFILSTFMKTLVGNCFPIVSQTCYTVAEYPIRRAICTINFQRRS